MKFYLSVYCLMYVITVVKSALLSISPSTNIQAGAPTLTVRCQPTTASGVTEIYRLHILRLTEGVSTEQNLGTIRSGKQPVLGPGLVNPKYTVTGSLTTIDAVSTSFVQIVIQDPNCNDKGEYICSVSAGNNEGSLNKEHRVNVTVQENPSNLDMNVVPSKSEFILNDSISMTCNGNVGNPAKTWQWQTRRFPASNLWFRYTDESDIVTDPVSPPLGTRCSYRQKTVLNYRVKAQDDGLQIRCILDNREEFSKNFTINLASSIETSTMSHVEESVTSTTATSFETNTLQSNAPSLEANTQSNGSKDNEDKTPVIVLGISVAILVVYGIVISVIAGYLYGKLKRDSRKGNASTYESVQHQPTINSVYTSLENNGHLQTVTGNK